MASVEAKSFLEDLKAAVMLGCNLETGEPELRSNLTANSLSIKQLKRLSIDATDSWPNRLTAAFDVFRKTNAMPIVFEALSVRLDSDRWVSSVLRRTWWYLLLVIATMVLGLFTVYHYTDQTRRDFIADLQLDATVKQTSETDITTWIPIAMGVAVVLGVTLSCWTLLGGSRWLTMRLGGRKILQIQQTATLLKILEQVDASATAKNHSIQLACDAVAAGPEIRSQIHAALDDASSNVGLNAWAESLTKDARVRMTKIELWVPVMFVTVIGGTLAIFYALLIYGPIMTMLQDLASAAGVV